MSGDMYDMTKWTLSGGGVIVNVTAKMNADGSVTLSYNLDENSAQADLNGIFIDFGNNGGTITSIGTKSNNMNGSDTDGDKLDGFDLAQVLGTVGGSDADNVSGTWTISAADLQKYGITSLSQLADAEIGIRATSVGEYRDGSVKLADIGEFCPAPTETDDYPDAFPLSNATLIFDVTDSTKALDKNGDGYVAVKIDNWDFGKLDFDDYEAAILKELAADHGLSAEDFLGVILKGGNEPNSTQFYAKGDDNPDTDPFPEAPANWASTDADYWLNYPPAQGNIDATRVDLNYIVDDFTF
ncbi:hypothetical protein [Paracoccus sp. SY]|uniref:hypothetical protein n=1 Tax=Paracoccus sp. SY TaxID=1330255 RepID=UPI000CD2E3A4|nr:hypothetical protein [Paracoccus sp. SY]